VPAPLGEGAAALGGLGALEAAEVVFAADANKVVLDTPIMTEAEVKKLGESGAAMPPTGPASRCGKAVR
jgi:hypothetical protein